MYHGFPRFSNSNPFHWKGKSLFFTFIYLYSNELSCLGWCMGVPGTCSNSSIFCTYFWAATGKSENSRMFSVHCFQPVIVMYSTWMVDSALLVAVTWQKENKSLVALSLFYNKAYASFKKYKISKLNPRQN